MLPATPSNHRRRGQRQKHGREEYHQKPPVRVNQPPPVNEELLLIRRLDRAKRNIGSFKKVALCVSTLCVGNSIYKLFVRGRHAVVLGEALQSNGNALMRGARGNSRAAGGGGAFHRVPKELLQDFGSYPNILNITDQMRNEFHPVVKFPLRKKSKGVVGDDTCIESELKHRSFWPWQKGNGIERSAYENDLDALGGRKMNTTYAYIVRDFTGSNKDDSAVLLEGGRRVPQLLATREEALLYAKIRKTSRQFDVGRYDEDRRGMYESSLFAKDNYQRTVHVGIDIGGPVGTAVYAFEDGIIHSAGYNPELGDYGHVMVIEHILTNHNGLSKVYALYGHLSAKSTQGKRPGEKIKRGQTIGYMGNTAENGGWTGLCSILICFTLLGGVWCSYGYIFTRSSCDFLGSHLHFQLALNPPTTHDMPGVVSVADRAESLLEYIGKIFDAAP